MGQLKFVPNLYKIVVDYSGQTLEWLMENSL
jgi:hypothetical protein